MPGRHFLQIPGPTNVPERVLRAMDRPVPDHRGPEMPALTSEIVERLRPVFGTEGADIVFFPGSGTAAWEASIVNTLRPGQRVLALNNGHFSYLYAECAQRMGMRVDKVDFEWGTGASPEVVSEQLAADGEHEIAAVLVVHNETSTGVTSDVALIRRAMDAAHHPALLLVDTVSSLASIEFRFDDWGVDVALTGAQKGLMLPPGMALLAVSKRAAAAARDGGSPRYVLDWGPMIEQLHRGYFPYTPATLLLFGLREALRMLDEEGLPHVFARHARLADGVRAAVQEWDLEILCRDPARYSNTLTAVVLGPDVDAENVLRKAEETYQLSLGTGLGRLRGRAFRIGHLGSLNEVEVLATLAGTELALRAAGAHVRLGSGVAACQQLFESTRARV